MTHPAHDPHQPHAPAQIGADQLFDGLSGSDELDALEAGRAGNRMAAFEAVIDDKLNTVFYNPRELVQCYLRPGREFSTVMDRDALSRLPKDRYTIDMMGINGPAAFFLPDTAYQVTRATFMANRAVLASRAEYNKIKMQMGTIQHQTVQRQVQEMRSHQSQVTAQSMTPKERELVDRFRGQAQQEETAAARAEEAQAQVVKERQHDQRVQDQVALETRLESMNQEQFAAHKARMRSDAEALAARLGERGQSLLLLFSQEERELDARWQRILTQRAAERTPDQLPQTARVGLEEAARRLRRMRDQDIISEADYDRQLAQLINSTH